MPEITTPRKVAKSLFKARFSDFDLQGILNSSQYLDIFSEARLEQMDSYYQYPFENFLKRGLTFVVAKYEITFHRPIVFGKKFMIQAEVISMEGAHAKLEFRFLSDDEKVIYASGLIVHTLVDISAKRPTEFTDEDRMIFLSHN